MVQRIHAHTHTHTNKQTHTHKQTHRHAQTLAMLLSTWAPILILYIN